MPENNRYLRFAKDVALEAGICLKRNLGKVKKISYKGKIDLVTDVDRRSEKLILNRIHKTFPSHKILSEERGLSGRRKSDFCWLIDPLDGTTNYIHSFNFFCVSVALLRRKRTIAAAIYDPVQDELFSASKGRGAFLNHKRIRPSNIRKLDRGLLATGFPYKYGKAMRQNINNFGRFLRRAQAVRRAGSAALDLCYVACGRFDGFWELDLNPWDTAAGALIVEEAGGKVTTLKNRPYSCFIMEILASNSRIHTQMARVLQCI